MVKIIPMLRTIPRLAIPRCDENASVPKLTAVVSAL
jgi:hypothetical protein